MIFLADFFKTRSSWVEEYGDTPSWSWFSLTHILILVATIIFCVIFAYLYRKGDDKKRKIYQWIIVGLMLVEEAQMFIISIATNQFEIGFLPLHLCGINIFFCIAHAIWGKNWISEFLYALALPGALLALIVPTWTSVPPNNFIFIFSTGYHIFLIAYPIMLLAGGFKPKFKNLKYVAYVLIPLSIVIFGINQFTNHMAVVTNNFKFWSTNFMFLYKPESLFTVLANLFHLEGMWYLITLPFLLVLIWGLFYTPWYLLEKKQNKLSV
jgi:uncharacterized membrane protein YwaF